MPKQDQGNTRGPVYALRKAGIFDLPFIHALMLEGSGLGVFTDLYRASGGQVLLFKNLFRDLIALPRLFRGRYSPRQFFIFALGDTDIGFVALHDLYNQAGVLDRRHICECAIRFDRRRQGHGGRLIRMVLDATHDGACVSVDCTAHATAMQALLAKSGVRRRQAVDTPPGILPIYRYIITPGLTRHAKAANSRSHGLRERA